MKGKLTNPSGPHLSEALVRRYELVFERFLTIYPGAFTIEPSELAPTTVCSQIRMAANTLINFGPGSNDSKFQSIVDCEILRSVWPKVQVTIRDSKIVIGTRDAQKEAAVELVKDRQNQAFSLIEIANPSESVMSALVVLLSERALVDPITLTGHVPQIQLPPGIVLEKNSDGTYTML